LGLVAVAALGLGLYGRSVRFDFTHTDDTVLLVDDARFIGDLANVPKTLSRPFFRASVKSEGYYRPLVTSSFILDAQWTATRAAGYHAMNVLWHVAACWLVFFVLEALGFGYAAALIGTLAFCASPAVAEAVYWVPGRCDLLLGVGFLTSTLFFFRYLRDGSTLPLLGHLVGLAAALLSKEAGLMIPLALVAYVLLVEMQPRALRDWRPWVGWGAVLSGWYAIWSAAGPVATSETLAQRLGTVWSNLPVLVVQLGKTVIPIGLSVLANARDASPTVGAILFLLGMGSALWLSGRPRALFVWGGLVFLLFLLPTLAVSDFLILENRLYVPTMGILVSCLAVARAIRERWTLAAFRPLAIVGPAITLVFATVTWRYGDSFKDAPSFTAEAVDSSPHLALVSCN
jgi:protein O-mannosyl-transferase